MKHTLPRSIFFGWKVVGTAFIVATFTWGVGFYGLSVLLHELHRSRGWSISVISAAITTHFVISALMVAYLDAAHRRFGLDWVTRAGIVASATGILCWVLTAAPWQMFGAAILTGGGWAATSGAAITAMVSPWFVRRRPIALGLALNGSSFGGVLFTPLWIILIARFGLIGAAGLISATMIAVLWPLTGRYFSVTPERLGLAPDGGDAPAGYRIPAKPAYPTIPLASLLRNRRFITLSMAFAFGLFAQVGVVIHLVSRLAEPFGAAGAAGAVSLVTACAAISRLVLGAFMGDADRRLVGMGNFVLKASGIICLALGTSSAVLLAGCVLFGLGMGNLLLLAPLIAQNEFPRSDVPRVVALVTAGNQALFAFAPAVFGILSELFHGYEAVFLLAAFIEVIAGAILIVGRVRFPLRELT